MAFYTYIYIHTRHHIYNYWNGKYNKSKIIIEILLLCLQVFINSNDNKNRLLEIHDDDDVVVVGHHECLDGMRVALPLHIHEQKKIDKFVFNQLKNPSE